MYQADGRSGLGCSPPAHGSLRRCSAPRGSPCSSQDGDGHVEGSGPGHSGRSQDTARSSDVGEGWGKCAQTQQAARLHPSGDSAENVVRPLMSSERQRLSCQATAQMAFRSARVHFPGPFPPVNWSLSVDSQPH